MTANACPECQTQVPDDAPNGLCPCCLLLGGMGGTMETPGSTNDERPEALAALFPQLEIQQLLGRGGMGVVYRARQLHLDRLVALKLLPRESGKDPAFAERFGREARALARLMHPGIILVHDSGCVDGQYFLVMEYADGGNLRDAVRGGKLQAALVTGDWRPAAEGGRLNPVVAAHILCQLCDALQYARDQGIVHRDLKPENILLTRTGGVKVADFGLAKLLDPTDPGAMLTGTGQVLGTFHYMAPEQLATPHSVDHRADLYALGVIFYELLTGDRPSVSFPPPSQFVPSYPGFDAVVLRALARDPAQRYQEARELRAAVEAVLASAPGVAAADSLASGEFRLSEVAGPGLLRVTRVGRILRQLFQAGPSLPAPSQLPVRQSPVAFILAPEFWAVSVCFALIGVLFAPWATLQPKGGSARVVREKENAEVPRSIEVYLRPLVLDGGHPTTYGLVGATVGAVLLFLILLTRGVRWSGLLQGVPVLIGGLVVLTCSLVFVSDTRREHQPWPVGFVQLQDWNGNAVPARNGETPPSTERISVPAHQEASTKKSSDQAEEPIDSNTLLHQAWTQHHESVLCSVGWGAYVSVASGGVLIFLSVPLLRQTRTRRTATR
jgi:protein kinase-like protein